MHQDFRQWQISILYQISWTKNIFNFFFNWLHVKKCEILLWNKTIFSWV